MASRIYKGVCKEDGCDAPVKARGWCEKHWTRWYNHGDPSISLLNREHDGVCSVEGCEAPYSGRGFCIRHLRKYDAHGDPLKGQPRKKHGQSGKHSTPTYRSWCAMRDRCLNPNDKAYEHWGGRGIVICERWLGDDGFKNFLADMGERPEGRTLDRIDNDGNYEPTNCRWATPTEQSRNQRDPGGWKTRRERMAA